MFQECKMQINLDNFDDYNMVNVWYRHAIIKNEFTFTHKHKIVTPLSLDKILEKLGASTKSQILLIEEDRLWSYAEKNDAAFLIISHNKDSEYTVYISTKKAVEQEPFLKIVKDFPQLEKKDNEMPVTFMYATDTRIVKKTRNICVPAWNEIEMNYSHKLSQSIDNLFKLKPPVNHGKIILWHGKPGTGKSHALRALLREWKWCDGYYIVDPEALFRNPAYLMDILFDSKEEYDSFPGDPPTAINNRWKLFIMEDADEFLTSDAKQHQGQNISRLLNISDGLIGQGLNILLLFTTNEPIERLHPAIIRAGRCLADIEFSPLSLQESINWMKIKGLDEGLVAAHKESDNTLADLYSKLNKMNKIQHDVQKPRIGF